ncbi:MAG: UDP-N-acetylmuramoyl-L-alanine--D-glutamate ligase, partial [Oscillospiraceae bacterium]|nr:UDP-N-acetylmuramoyl-L-alanine--D-glutamate ligase [Oscillospiraceae bacterium]
MTKAEKFFEDIKNKNVSFIGTGVTNNDTIRLFLKKGINVTVCDKKSREDMGTLADEFEAAGAKLSLGENYLDPIFESDIVFRAPGVYYH